jgi:hypothetical protein
MEDASRANFQTGERTPPGTNQVVLIRNSIRRPLLMLTTLTLALTASLPLSTQATAQEKKQPPTAPPQELKSIASWVAPFKGVTLQWRA